MLRPFQFGALIFAAVVAQAGPAFSAPSFETLEPIRSLGRHIRPGEKHFFGRRRFREIHHAADRNQSMPGLPLVGRGRPNYGQDDDPYTKQPLKSENQVHKRSVRFSRCTERTRWQSYRAKRKKERETDTT